MQDSKPTGPPSREERAARALRDNLRRRKGQQQARAGAAKEEETPCR